MKIYQPTVAFRFAAYLLLAGMLHLSTGCNNNYYLYNTATSTKSGIDKIKKEDYLIIHFQDVSWHMSDLVIDREKEVFSGIQREILSEHQGHENPKKNRNRYKKSKENPTIELHIYISSYEENPDNTVSIPMASITQINIYNQDLSNTGFTILFTVTMMAVMDIVAKLKR